MQSTNHVLLVQPAAFSTNPDTTPTNQYQYAQDIQTGDHLSEALEEFYGFREVLIKAGVSVTTVLGTPECPDHIFPDWFTTHPEQGVIYYPMHTPSRSAEQTQEITNTLERHYKIYKNFKTFEAENKCLEGPAALVMDRVHKIAYGSLSKRISPEVAAHFGYETGYKMMLFDTQAHDGNPVYHTDMLLWIGTQIAGFVADCLPDASQKQDVIDSLSKDREVMIYSKEQLGEMCGNSLEVIGKGGKPYIIMSSRAYRALTTGQKNTLSKYFEDILHAPLDNIERYGGGSARCMIGELF